MAATKHKEQDRTNFRDKVSTVDQSGNRLWLFPRKPKGRYYNARTLVSVVLLAVLFSGPFIRIDGQPLLLMNVLERKFIIFGQIFWPQDFHLFVIGVITMIMFVVLFTVVFGRVFCGWVCPQTIFMEMVFRKIEYWIEGDSGAQKKLQRMPWNQEKIRKKALKHSIFLFISFLISNTFLAYIIGSEQLIEIITDPPSEHLAGLTAISIFSLVFYGVFAKFREQVCTNVCPYGRLQGVLLDKKSVVVAYDYVRGEERSKFKKNEDREAAGKGDCIDCHQCVDVCPTGIDIRNGTQLECVNCTACIDACDSIMDKIGKDRGLIRYDSEEGIAEGKKLKWNARSIAYSVLLVVLAGFLVSLLIMRTDVETSFLRTPGMLFQDQGDGKISNLYQYKLINKTNEDLSVHFKILDKPGEVKLVGKEGNIAVPNQQIGEGALFLIFDREEVEAVKSEIEIGVFAGDQQIDSFTTNFLGPGA